MLSATTLKIMMFIGNLCANFVRLAYSIVWLLKNYKLAYGIISSTGIFGRFRYGLVRSYVGTPTAHLSVARGSIPHLKAAGILPNDYKFSGADDVFLTHESGVLRISIVDRKSLTVYENRTPVSHSKMEEMD